MSEEKDSLEKDLTAKKEKSDAELRKEQRLWLIELLEAKMEGKDGKYRLKENVPMPKQQSYREKDINTVFFMQPIETFETERFDEMQAELKRLSAEEMKKETEGMQKDLKKLNSAAFGVGRMPELSKTKIDMSLEKAKLQIATEIDAEKVSEIASVLPKITQIKPLYSDTKLHVQISDSIPAPEKLPGISVAKEKMQLREIAEMKQNRADEMKKITAAKVAVNTDAVEKKLSLSEELRTPSVSFSEIASLAAVSGKLMDILKANELPGEVAVTFPERIKPEVSAKMTVTSETVRPNILMELSGRKIGEGVLGQMDVSLTAVTPKIRNLVEEIGLSTAETEEKKLEKLAAELGTISVSMPDFTDVWATIKQ